MSNKPIIIDGVDVKDCKRRIGKDNYCRYYKRPCSENNFNCIWKKYLRKEQECETLSSQLDFEVQKKECLEQECEDLKQTLTEIKPILEFYANSNMGEEQPDKTYHIMLDGSYIMVYDSKPARQALQKISECGVER